MPFMFKMPKKIILTSEQQQSICLLVEIYNTLLIVSLVYMNKETSNDDIVGNGSFKLF